MKSAILPSGDKWILQLSISDCNKLYERPQRVLSIKGQGKPEVLVRLGDEDAISEQLMLTFFTLTRKTLDALSAGDAFWSEHPQWTVFIAKDNV